MALDASAVIDRLVSHALTLGVFDRVNAHEPRQAPGAGVTCAVWADQIRPVPAQSGLNATSVLLVFKVRVYTSMFSDPPDAIDPAVLTAVDALMAAYTGDFTLGGVVREVDLLGLAGTGGLTAQAGYLNQDGKLLRIMDVAVPTIIDNLWTQTA